MKKKILIPGAGNAQIDLIKRCSVYGLETFGCSYRDDDPGIPYLDHFEKIDIKHVHAVLEYAQRISADLIYSIGSDLAMPTVCLIAEKMGLRRLVSSETAMICCHKGELRRKLQGTEWEVPFVCGRTADDLRRKWNGGYPVQIKPVDSQGQRGVCRVGDENDLEESVANALRFSGSGEVIMEQDISGDEISVNVLLQNGRIVQFWITDREAFPEYPGGIIQRHRMPSGYIGTDTEKKIRRLVEEVLQLVGITEGPAYFQIIIQKGRPFLIEVTPRLDGCHLWRLIRTYSGCDLLAMTMDMLLRNEENRESVMYAGNRTSMEDRHLMLEFFSEPPGTVFQRPVYEKKPALHLVFYYRDGDMVRPVNGYMEKCGFRICMDQDGDFSI